MQLAGGAGRGARRRDLSRLSRGRGALRRGRRGARRRHRQPRHRQGRRADRRASSSAWSCTRKYTIFAEGSRGSLGRQLIARFKLDEGRDPQSYGIGLKELWEVQPERAEPGLVLHTAGWPLDTEHLRRLVPLSPRQQPGRARLRRRPRLREPLAQPVRGVAALEDAPGDPEDARGRQAPRLRRARDHRRRHPQPAEDGVPRRRLRRLRGRLPQREPDQGQPCRDQDRHARRRGGVRRARRRSPARRARRLPGGVREELAARRARAVAQLQAVVQEGPHRSPR